MILRLFCVIAFLLFAGSNAEEFVVDAISGMMTIPKSCLHVCKQGACLYENCKYPQCPGGACHFIGCEYPSCAGKFHDD